MTEEFFDMMYEVHENNRGSYDILFNHGNGLTFVAEVINEEIAHEIANHLNIMDRQILCEPILQQ